MPSEWVNKTQFKAKALEYLRKIETSGDPIVVTDRGHATIEIRRFRSEQCSALERLRGSVLKYDHPTEPISEQDWDALN